jgi:hypothetical protein
MLCSLVNVSTGMSPKESVMTRHDSYGPLPLFSRESYEIFRATYFFMAMCALCLVAFAVSAALGVERAVLAVPFFAAAACLACTFATFFVRSDAGTGHVAGSVTFQQVPPQLAQRRTGVSISLPPPGRRSRATR